MRMFFGMIAAVVLWTSAAYAAPGDVAKNSKVYYEVMHPNGKDCSNLVASPELKDELATKLESEKNDPAKFAKIKRFWAEQCGVMLAKVSVQERKVSAEGGEAQTAPDESDRRPVALTANDTDELERIARRALGPVPQDARAYRAHVTARSGAPAPGCVRVQEVKPGKGTLIRWRCPRGTINRLGW